MNEAAKIRDRIMSYLTAKTVVDLGCGNEKVVPWAVGVDDYREQGDRTTGADVVCALEVFCPVEKFDVVFSSHALEHLSWPLGETLARWVAMAKLNGHLILYLPDERHYVYDHQYRRVRNPAHKHYLVPEVVLWHLEQLPVVVEVMEPDLGPDRYSCLFVCRRVR